MECSNPWKLDTTLHCKKDPSSVSQEKESEIARSLKRIDGQLGELMGRLSQGPPTGHPPPGADGSMHGYVPGPAQYYPPPPANTR